MKTVLSWDVGIKNLAYCLMTFVDNKWNIISWDNINISSNIPDTNVCWKCKKKATMFYISENKEYYLCGTHKKLYVPDTLVFEELFVENSGKQKCNKENCKLNGKYVYKDNNYCKTHAKQIFTKMEKGNKLQKIAKAKSVMKESIEDLTKNLVTMLDERKFMLQADIVLIENQPAFKNPKMKTIGCCLHDYFLIRGIIDKCENSKITEIKYFSASNKLKLNNENTFEILSNTKENNIYKVTKNLGKEYANKMLSDQPDKIEFLNKHKKKDDLCDCFLQGAYFLSLSKK